MLCQTFSIFIIRSIARVIQLCETFRFNPSSVQVRSLRIQVTFWLSKIYTQVMRIKIEWIKMILINISNTTRALYIVCFFNS